MLDIAPSRRLRTIVLPLTTLPYGSKRATPRSGPRDRARRGTTSALGAWLPSRLPRGIMAELLDQESVTRFAATPFVNDAHAA
jgi:hypothetical protein